MCLTAVLGERGGGAFLAPSAAHRSLQPPLVAEPRHGSTGLRGSTRQTAVGGPVEADNADYTHKLLISGVSRDASCLPGGRRNHTVIEKTPDGTKTLLYL